MKTLNENFSNILDSSVIDYTSYAEKGDLEIIERKKAERGYISEDEYQEVVDAFKDFIIPEETYLRQGKNIKSSNTSLSMINLTLSREKFEQITGIKKSSVFYKKETFLKIDGKLYPRFMMIDDHDDYKSSQIWRDVRNGKSGYTGDFEGILIYDKITFQINRPKRSRPYFQLRTLKHMNDNVHTSKCNRGTHIAYKRDHYGEGFFDLEQIINMINKKLYHITKFPYEWCPKAHKLTY